MEGPDNRAQWMRSRGVEIYTSATLNLLQDFKSSREYDMVVANAVLVNTSGEFGDLMWHLPNALTSGVLDYLDRQGFDEALHDVSTKDEEIRAHTAAVNNSVYEKPAQKRGTTHAAVHFVDSLMFGLRLPIALASDACLSKHTLRGYDGTATKPMLNELVKIMRNESFNNCLNDDFAKTGFGVLSDEFTKTDMTVYNNAHSYVRRLRLGLVKGGYYLFSYDATTDRFSVHSEAKRFLQQAYRQQNLNETIYETDSSLEIGYFKKSDKAFTAGCPLRYESEVEVPVIGIKEATTFVANFCESVLTYMRLPRMASPQLIELARTALEFNAQVQRLLG